MTAGLAIRRYDPADEERAWRIHERATKRVDAFADPTGVEGGVATTPAEHATESRRLADRGVLLVGEVDGTVVATGALDPDGGAEAGQSPDGAEITRMRVDPDHWRAGYGQAMLERLEREARSAGWTTLHLETLARQEAARGLYEANGYEPVGEVVVGEYDVRRYRKELAD
jgi:GNAT superfamily N-acetyltransferase